MALSYVAPSAELAAELAEVRADAAGLTDLFAQINAPLPIDFPREAVIELATALQELPDGTAKGCLRPLNEAQAQLATIRSQHIRHDYSEEEWKSDRPVLFRGEPLDQRLRALMSSVSTALQTANRLAAEEPDSEAPEASVAALRDSSTSDLIANSSKAQVELDEERNELNALKIGSRASDTLGRRLTDVSVLNRLSRGELRLPRIAPSRLRRIVSALREYPSLLQKAAELVTVGAQFADYVHEKWSSLQTRIFQAGTSTVREIAEDMSDYAKRLEANNKATGALSTEPPPDFDLYEATRMIHAGEAPPQRWKPFIEYLPLGSRRLRSLTPLAGLTSLRSIHRPSVIISDISPISELPSLSSLNLSNTKVTDLSALKNLTLKHLNLSGMSITDLSPISFIRNLTSLIIDETNVIDLTPLSQLLELVHLSAKNTPIADLTPLSKLPKLESLYLNKTSISEVASLKSLTNLGYLDISGTKVSDLSPLSDLKCLSSLAINNTDISDLTPLTRLPELNDLSLFSTKVYDFRQLGELRNLRLLVVNAKHKKKISRIVGPKVGVMYR